MPSARRAPPRAREQLAARKPRRAKSQVKSSQIWSPPPSPPLSAGFWLLEFFWCCCLFLSLTLFTFVCPN